MAKTWKIIVSKTKILLPLPTRDLCLKYLKQQHLILCKLSFKFAFPLELRSGEITADLITSIFDTGLKFLESKRNLSFSQKKFLLPLLFSIKQFLVILHYNDLVKFEIQLGRYGLQKADNLLYPFHPGVLHLVLFVFVTYSKYTIFVK